MDDSPFQLADLPAEWKGYDEWVKGLKNNLVADADHSIPGADDLTPRIEFYRGGRVVANVICQQVDRDEALQAGFMGVPGFRAEEVRVTFDVHVAGKPFLDKYGRTPDPHELQHLCDAEGACELGLITDAMATLRATRDGLVEQLLLPYHVNHAAKEVHWQDAEAGFMKDTGSEKAQITGIVADSFRSFFERPTIAEMAAQAGQAEEYEVAKRGLAPWEAELHEDIAMVRLMASAGFMVGYFPQNDEEAAILRKSMERSGVTAKLFHGDESDDIAPAEDYEPSELDRFGRQLAAKFAYQRATQRADELAEAERRRTARVAAGAGDHKQSAQEVVNGLLNGLKAKEGAPMSRADRRAAARQK